MNKYLLLLLAVLLFPSSALAAGPYHDTVVIVLDGSGSMKGTLKGSSVVKMDAAKRALKDVLKQVEPETHVGLLVFAGKGIYWAYKPAAVNAPTLEAAIDKIQPGAQTPLGQAIKIAADRLMADRKKQHGLGRYQLLVVTDGEASDAPVMKAHAAELSSRQIPMDVIGVAMAGGATHSLAQFGRSYPRADDAVQLVSAIRKAIIVEAGGASGIAVDFDETANLPLESARAWLEALSAPAPNHPLGTKPPAPPKKAKKGASSSAPASPANPPTRRKPTPNSGGCSLQAKAGQPWREATYGFILFAMVALGLRRNKR